MAESLHKVRTRMSYASDHGQLITVVGTCERGLCITATLTCEETLGRSREPASDAPLHRSAGVPLGGQADFHA